MSDTDEFESLADWMGEQDWTVNVRDYTDEYTTHVRDQPVELLAERLMQSSWLAERDAKVRSEIADEIEAERIDTGDGIGFEAYVNGLRRAEEIAREGRT